MSKAVPGIEVSWQMTMDMHKFTREHTHLLPSFRFRHFVTSWGMCAHYCASQSQQVTVTPVLLGLEVDQASSAEQITGVRVSPTAEAGSCCFSIIHSRQASSVLCVCQSMVHPTRAMSHRVVMTWHMPSPPHLSRLLSWSGSTQTMRVAKSDSCMTAPCGSSSRQTSWAYSRRPVVHTYTSNLHSISRYGCMQF